MPMQAAQMVAPGRLEIVDVPIPEPADGEVLVRTHRSSICGSDLHIVYDGFYLDDYPAPPGFPGHEGVGVVERSRSSAFLPGDAVLVAPVPHAARCFSEWQVVSEHSLVTLPAGADLNRLLMAQQLGTTIYAMRRFWPTALEGSPEGRTVAICGAGSAGLFFAQLARRAGFGRVLIADKVPSRLSIAWKFGVDAAVDVHETSFVDAVAEFTDGVGADLVIEAAGYDETRIQCLRSVRLRGRIGLFGFPERPTGPTPWDFAQAWAKQPTVEHNHSTQLEPGLTAFREAVALIHSGDIDVTPFLDAVYELEDVQRAFEAARHQQGGKIAITMPTAG